MNEITILKEFDSIVTDQKKVDWEILVTAGMQARELKDGIQWYLGELGMKAVKDYGTDALGKFANEIGVEKSTLSRYRDVAKAFPREIREKYKALSWTHFRTIAARENRDELLERAHDDNMSVEQLVRVVAQEVSGVERPRRPGLVLCTCGKWYIGPKDVDVVCMSGGQH